MRITKNEVPAKIDVPGAKARQVTGFGDVSGYGTFAGEYFSLAAGVDMAPLLKGLENDACNAPHWGFMIAGEVVVTFANGDEETCVGDDLFYWPAGHSVRVVQDAEMILFSPQAEHVAVMDHVLAQMGG